MMLALYRWAGVLGWPVIRAYLARRKFSGKEDRARFSERLGRAARPRPQGPLVWLHGASIGEALSLLPLVDQLLAEHPNVHALVTTGTVTSAALMGERLPDRAFHQYLPVDSQLCVRPFLDHWRPDLVLWAESELWPVLISDTRKRGTPMVLINGRMSARSFERWQRHPSMVRHLLGCFDLCLVQTDTDAERFYRLGANNARVAGNLKFAVPSLPVDEPERTRLAAQIGKRPLWLAASTHPGEESIAARVHKALKSRYPDLLTIIAPRHPARMKEIEGELQAMNLSLGVRTRGDGITAATDIYLADTVGEMGLFYRLSDITFLGKSLTSEGGQNPIEAACLKTAVLSGPKVSNFEDIMRTFKRAGAMETVADEAELAAAIDALLGDTKTRTHRMDAGLAVTEREAGVLENIMDELKPSLEKLGGGT